MTDSEQKSGLGGAQDPFEMFRRLWAPLGLSVPGMAMPTLDPKEVEKRIADLKSVETWLGMNLNMVRMAIQGLEVQKMALDAMQPNAGAAGEAANAFAKFAATVGAPGHVNDEATRPTTGSNADPSHSLATSMLWPWAMMQSGAIPGASAEKPASPRRQESKRRKARK